MKVTGIKTHRITVQDNLFAILDQYLPKLEEKSVVCITSKIVSICEKRIIPTYCHCEEEAKRPTKQSASKEIPSSRRARGRNDNCEIDHKDDLIKQEAQFYLPRSLNKYNVSLTITKNVLAASAGIDESNGNGYYILWPKDVQKSANMIRSFLQKKLGLSHIGVVITDSKTTPLRWGVTGFSLAHSGFAAVNTYIGKKDLFGRAFEYEKVHIADSMSASAVSVMGEGAEQTPLAIIEEVPFVTFQNRNPLQKELDEIKIAKEDDIYAPLLVNVNWKRGKG
ncbi:MAG: hypothetical protein A3F31_04300 [Candidatus Levybacteria bacterium RIFCSPHIGHO2_12_FULL_38_12]|nr:MAG: hypothetical protein A2770_02780 [Candidatus Levybacteria bacterium RIFCSPHIGHO2_01_FULL_38_12]OGH22697.1 MAG: hypothetical protein A3F31_04300 [Candidatus Levybacteria bacterium RIFCSPHIGHO2_12_FULL_38_12]OGH34412.1 MAG: hypothetical protein A3A47_04675 [Candidatus Levybacteria bacterium RIFCSPLOWO2_01_FULL_37_20]OGH44404.1 MAG: hypothetical protein A3J14_03035 [Candidatus Levybacteria bacterium RIFCSPLOWO2_02_FULL_37_18]OGH51268.1 MAG: hypothetical protein A3G13_00070 [Candidatus Levy